VAVLLLSWRLLSLLWHLALAAELQILLERHRRAPTRELIEEVPRRGRRLEQLGDQPLDRREVDPAHVRRCERLRDRPTLLRCALTCSPTDLAIPTGWLERTLARATKAAGGATFAAPNSIGSDFGSIEPVAPLSIASKTERSHADWRSSSRRVSL